MLPSPPSVLSLRYYYLHLKFLYRIMMVTWITITRQCHDQILDSLHDPQKAQHWQRHVDHLIFVSQDHVMFVFNSDPRQQLLMLKIYVSNQNKFQVFIPNKRGTSLESKLLEGRYMSRPELFQLYLPIFIQKMVSSNMCGLPFNAKIQMATMVLEYISWLNIEKGCKALVVTHKWVTKTHIKSPWQRHMI